MSGERVAVLAVRSYVSYYRISGEIKYALCLFAVGSAVESVASVVCVQRRNLRGI